MDCKGVLAVIAVLGSSITVGCGGTSSGADSELSRESGALDRGDLSGSCFLIKTAASNGRYLDAYTSGNGDVVTRPPQGNDTQHWCFTARAWVGSAPYYVIAHRSSTGQVLDAYTASNGYKAVLRDDNGDDTTQQWEPIGASSAFQLRQRASGRSLTHSTSTSNDYRAYTVADTPLTWFLETLP
jgi:hypothetical protein